MKALGFEPNKDDIDKMILDVDDDGIMSRRPAQNTRHPEPEYAAQSLYPDQQRQIKEAFAP